MLPYRKVYTIILTEKEVGNEKGEEVVEENAEEEW